MTLEHYPGMTEKCLADIEAQARERWPLSDVLIIHRYGTLKPSDRIVLWVAAAQHRAAAFEAVQFLMDYLKPRAPFWKQEERAGEQVGERSWVAVKDSDEVAARRWATSHSRDEAAE